MTSPVDAVSATQLAKAALRRLAVERAEPTPENYARAYAQEQGSALPAKPPAAVAATATVVATATSAVAPSAPGVAVAETPGGAAAATAPVPAAAPIPASTPDTGPAWSALIDRLVRGLERGGRQWTSARKKDSLQRVLQGSRADAGRLLQRLDQLIGSWDGDDTPIDVTAEPPPAAASPSTEWGTPDLAVAAHARAARPSATTTPETPWATSAAHTVADGVGAPADDGAERSAALAAGEALVGVVQAALVPVAPTGASLAEAIQAATQAAPVVGVAALQALCHDACVTLGHRHQTFDAMGQLCRELTASLADLAEDDSWAEGQCAAMQTRLDEGLSARGVRSVSALLHDTRQRHHALRAERAEAREALKALIQRLLSELGELGTQTGRFHDNIDRHAAVIEHADSLEGLASAVRALVDESRGVQSVIGAARQRIDDDRQQASRLNERVATLEAELRRLSDEVVTDQLTQVANRRGMVQAFEALTVAGTGSSTVPSSTARKGDRPPLSVGLLDIDNFKRLNDQLGHTVGDEALKALAGAVARALRPADVVARYGGEEFVVLLPDTPLDDAQQILTRLQRSLSGGLFLHEGKQVFVTFSAGVTRHVAGEAIEEALERADRGLYEAKRAGKNRTCVA